MSQLDEQIEAVPRGFFSRNGLERLCREVGISPSKSLGQNFLFQRSTLYAMVRDLPLPPNTTVIEIGCGFGHLTVPLLAAGYRVIGFEKDARLYERVSKLAGPDLQIIHGDICSCDLSAWIDAQADVAVVGNLPYSSAVQILFHLLNWYEKLSIWCFLVQREVADRIRAKPGSSRYGRLSVLLQYLFSIRLLRRIGPGCFYPRPKVESAWIRLTPSKKADLELALDWMQPLVKVAFSHRRKKVASNLACTQIGETHLKRETIWEQLRLAGAKKDCRPQDLSPMQYARLAELIRCESGSRSERGSNS